MTTITPFKVFINEGGVTSVLPMHKPLEQFKPNIYVTREAIAQWYWMLSSLMVKYTYTINDYPMTQEFCMDMKNCGLHQRVLGDLNLTVGPLENEELEIKTNCMFCIQQVYEVEKEFNYPDFSNIQSSLMSPLSGVLTTKRFGLCFNLEEYAFDNSFWFGTTIYAGNAAAAYENFVQIDARVCPLMDGEIQFMLKTPDPEEYEGKIDDIQLIPTFFTLQSETTK